MEVLREILICIFTFILAFAFLLDALLNCKELFCQITTKRHPADQVKKVGTALLPFTRVRELCKSFGYNWQEVITKNFTVYIDGKHSGQVSMSVQG